MWTRETIECLIIQYQQHEVLYNVRHPSYLDRVKRSDALFTICQELKKFCTDITPECIKKKIHSLRAQYIKENRAICSSKRSGVGADDVYVPKLWYYPQLEFLKKHCMVRKSESNISNISEIDESDESFLNLSESTVSNTSTYDKRIDESDNSFVFPSGSTTTNVHTPPLKKRKKALNFEDRIENVKKLILNKSEQKNCYDWLGKQVVFEITNLKNEKIRKDAVWSIQEILRKYSLQDAQAEPQPSCSHITPPPESSFIPIQPLRPSSSSSEYHLTPECTSQSSPSVDILQQSLLGVLDDDDF